MRRLQQQEIRALLSKPKWGSHDLMDHSAPLRNPPTMPTLRRLAQAAGLADPSPDVLPAFHSQLRFVETLAEVDVSNIEPIIRLVEPVDVKLEDDEPPQAPSWSPVSTAKEHAGEFYVVKEGLGGNH